MATEHLNTCQEMLHVLSIDVFQYSAEKSG